MNPLSDHQVERFVADGYVRLDDAFSTEQAAAAASVLYRDADVDPDDGATWPGPVLRVAGSGDPAVVETINTPRLTGSIDQLVGPTAWQRRTGFGTFPIRFPSDDDPGDAGWHIDGSFGEPPHYRVNLISRGRALLLLMLFTDVTEADAPTRIRVGSHVPVARSLRPLGEVAFLPDQHAPEVADLPVAHAVGPAGTVYLCHPFLVHAATWPHHGSRPRIIGQPCIAHPEGEQLGGFDYDAEPITPVKEAGRLALRNA